MKIVVLDGYSLNPGDLSWDALAQLGDLTVYDRTEAEHIVSRSAGAEIVITNKTQLSAETISQLPNLKYVGVLATGYNVVDTAAAAQAGIVVTNIPAYSTMSVAQVVFSHILSIISCVEHYTAEIREGRWSANPDFCYWDNRLTELAGKRMGIVGFGNIGSAVARIAAAFGMQPVIVTSRHQEDLPEGMLKAQSVDDVFATCDIVSLHCPLNEQTRNLVDARRLAMMKPSAILINTGRGPLVDEAALADALNEGRIYAAGLDVLSTEPPRRDNPLLAARNCFITPHFAWATFEARKRLMDIAVGNVSAFIDGSSVNRVN